VLLPGSAFITIEIFEKHITSDFLIGSCKIDLEDRYFSKNWRKLMGLEELLFGKFLFKQ